MEESLKQYSWLANLGVIALAAWLMAGLLATWIAERYARSSGPVVTTFSPPAPQTLNEVPGGKEAILARNLFGRKNPAATDEPTEAWADTGQTAVKTELKYSLLGTVVTPDPAQSICTVQLDNKVTKRYHPKELLDGKHEVRLISRGRVEFVNRDSRRLEFLAFPQRDISKTLPKPRGERIASAPTQGISQVSDSEFTIDQGEWDAAMANLNQIITQARAVPNIVDGKTDGFRVFAIRPGSIYQKLGIQNGDILSVVNGLQIDTLNKALTVFENLKSEKSFEIQIKRGGQPKLFKYEIK